jgi:hypothetical protein
VWIMFAFPFLLQFRVIFVVLLHLFLVKHVHRNCTTFFLLEAYTLLEQLQKGHDYNLEVWGTE